MASVTGLYRYPVKGLSAEPLDWLGLDRRQGLPYDRIYALALGSTVFAADAPEPLDKGHFLMLRANGTLAALRTGLDPATGVLTVRAKGRERLRADLSTEAGREAVGTFFTAYVGEAARGRVRLVSAAGHKFTDVSVKSPAMMRAVSMINLATVRALQEVVGKRLDPLRFRANIHVDGLAPWAELDWVGQDVRIGGMCLRRATATRRCAAIDVDPSSGERDTALPRAIVRHYGHPNLGIYLEVAEDGRVDIGDEVTPVACA